jgi:L-2-hydroxycarboxylate dehydrogenase (NAD+)
VDTSELTGTKCQGPDSPRTSARRPAALSSINPPTPDKAVSFVVPQQAHDSLVAIAFAHRGYFPDETSAMVRVAREAAIHGIHTHNAIKALHLDEIFGVRVGGCAPGAQLEELPPRFPAARAWNAHRKPGAEVAYRAMQKCVELAREYGVGMVSVDEAWHYLWGGAYALEAARNGCIGYTNCTALLAEVIPFGGRTPTLGTNPHSWAFPTQQSLGFCVLVDFATSAAATGRIQQMAREGRKLAPGWAVDDKGNETTDPSKAVALLPFGGHKGYGLGLVDELTAAYIGGSLPTQRGRFTAGDNAKRTTSFFFMAMNPDALTCGSYAQGMDCESNIRAVIADILGHGNEGSILPGQLEAEHARRSLAAGGLLFTEAELDAFDRVADECGHPRWQRSTIRQLT